jgi:hypothetical protein
MVPFMEKNELPPHWVQLVENSREKITEEDYKLEKIWLFSDPDVVDILMPERIPKNHNKSNRTPGVQETFTSSNVPSSTLLTGISRVLMMRPEFLNKKNISQTPCCLLFYLVTMNLPQAKILCQSLAS